MYFKFKFKQYTIYSYLFYSFSNENMLVTGASSKINNKYDIIFID